MEIHSDDGRFTLFAGAGYAAGDLDWRGISSGFEADTWTGTIGAEIRLTDHLVLGLAGTYLNTEGDFGPRGSVDAEGFALAAYLSFTQGNFYADTLYSYGNFEEDIHRRTGLGTTARGDPTSENHSVEFNTGYNFHLGALTTGPILGIDYRNGNLEGYNEHGDVRASLSYEDQNYDSLITRVGWQASYRIATGFGAITPQVRAAWERENLDENEWIRVSLVNSPYHWIAGGSIRPDYSVSARTTSPDNDYLNVGGGFLIEIGPDFWIVLDYQGHVFRSNSVEHFASISMGLRF
jgi:outer membrane lipase/esterase